MTPASDIRPIPIGGMIVMVTDSRMASRLADLPRGRHRQNALDRGAWFLRDVRCVAGIGINPIFQGSKMHEVARLGAKRAETDKSTAQFGLDLTQESPKFL